MSDCCYILHEAKSLISQKVKWVDAEISSLYNKTQVQADLHVAVNLTCFNLYDTGPSYQCEANICI